MLTMFMYEMIDVMVSLKVSLGCRGYAGCLCTGAVCDAGNKGCGNIGRYQIISHAFHVLCDNIECHCHVALGSHTCHWNIQEKYTSQHNTMDSTTTSSR